jgi:undecaprenyl-diphosphatase
MDYLKAVILAVVEGITEFLPISSTGHMILVEDLLRLNQPESFSNAFMVMIQLPAILSVVVYFWKELWPFGHARGFDASINLWFRIVIGFLPAAVLGFLLDDLIDAYLFNPLVVALALAVGGVLLVWLERRPKADGIPTAYDIDYRRAILIGLAQCVAMIPGTSRSAATIIGAMLFGCSRQAAVEFSFYLAIPTMLGATVLKLIKGGLDFTGEQWALLGIGSLVSFVVAYIVIAAFMGYVRKYSFVPFGWYRIALGALVIALYFAGLITV